MALSRKSAFQEHAAKVLASFNEGMKDASVYQILTEEDEAFKSVKVQNFQTQFLCAQLALIAQTWEVNCRNEGMAEADYSKAFLRKIMEAFQNPDQVQAASIFSEYYSAPEMEDQDSASSALASMIFKRLGQQPTFKGESGKTLIRPAFYQLVGALESLRTSFENQFFDFLHMLNPN